MVHDTERRRANSAPTMVALSAKGQGHVHYQRVANHLREFQLVNGVPSPGHPTTQQGSATNQYHTIVFSTNNKPVTRGSLTRLQQRRGTLGRALAITLEHKERIELKCCRINVLLVTMQACLGAIVVALAFYMETITPTLGIRECPYWAGFPLLFGGLVGLYYCITDFPSYAKSTKAFLIKRTCYVFSTSCIFLCTIACAFPGILGNKISSFAKCNMVKTNCLCNESLDVDSKVYVFESVDSCITVITSIKDYLILQSSLNCIAIGVCIWFVGLLWRSGYGKFNPGVRRSFRESFRTRRSRKVIRTTPRPDPPPSPIVGIPGSPHELHSPRNRSMLNRNKIIVLNPGYRV